MADLSEEIVRDYLGPLWYFSLKRTSDPRDAEDLTQEIITEILTALDRGKIPSDTRAWVWKIARNRYARYADRKHRRRVWEDADALTEDLSDGELPEDRLLREEERALLYRELALLSREFGTIVRAYYFENRSVAEIARSLRLPEGTVKRRLYESRKKIKEGMEMARTYGKRSFAPENIEFCQNWKPDTGEGGHRLIERLIPQNILLEAYDNPSSAEELSLALGVAVPYIEDEIKPLAAYGLLLKEGNRYKTGIVILSKKMQEEFYRMGEDTADRLTPVIRDAIEEIGKKDLGLPQPFSDFKPVCVDYLASRPLEYYPCKIHTIRHHDGAEWAILGMEKCEYNAPSLEVWSSDLFSQVMLLGNRKDPDSLTVDPSSVPRFRDFAALEAVMQNSRMVQIKAIFRDFAEKSDRILKEDIPSYLWNTALFTANIDFRRLVLDRLIASGFIVLPKDMNASPMGIWNYGE